MAANANWDNPTLSTTYTDFVTQVKNRDLDAATQFKDSVNSDTVPTDAIQWDTTNNRWNKYSGTAWGELTSTYSLSAVNITGATAPSNGIYLQAANTPTITSNSTNRLQFSDTGAFGLSGANYGSTGQVITSNGAGSAPTYQTPWLFQSCAVLADVKSTGQDAGTATKNIFQERVLNNKDIDADNIVTLVNALSSNTRFKLQAGTYIIEAKVPMFRSGRFVARLVSYDAEVDGTATQLKTGTSGFSQITYGGNEYSFIDHRFTISSETVLGIQTKCSNNNGGDGLGNGHSITGLEERYTTIKILKETS